MLERSSNELANILFPGTVLEKPIPDSRLVDEAVNKLPIAGDFNKVVGTGDFDHRKSSGGSVVISFSSGVVAKVPLGETDGDPFSRAKRIRDSIENFSSVAPRTAVILAEVDDGGPKPIVLQNEIRSTTLCKTPISKLLELQTLLDVRKIASKMKGWYKEKRAYDLCGQRTSDNLLGSILSFAPSLSDNIMVEDSGRAYLVDNVLDSAARMDSKRRVYKDFLRRNFFHNIPLAILDGLIFMRRMFDKVRIRNISGIGERATG